MQAAARPRIVKSDFAGAIRRNRRNSVFIFLTMVAIFAVFGYLIGWALELLLVPPPEARALSAETAGRIDWATLVLRPSLWGFAGIWLSALAALVWALVSMRHGGAMVMRAMGARRLSREEDPELFNVVEEMAIAAGAPVPAVFLIENDGMNAFAAGTSEERAAVAVTAGLRRVLTRDELQAVIAHETAHVVNGDMRFATLLAAFVGVISVVAGLLGDAVRLLLFGKDRRTHPAVALAALAVLVLVAVLAPIATFLVQMWASREREYLADATAVKLTRNPLGMIGALEKLGVSDTRIGRGRGAVEHLFLVKPKRALDRAGGAFCSHPPLADRIDRLRHLE